MITAEQKIARQQFIGSSDVSAILGIDGYRTAHDVYLDKTGQLDGDGGNDATDAGNRLESVVLDWAEDQLSAALLRNVMKVHPNGYMAANFDGIQPRVHNGPLPAPFTEPFTVEAKTTGIVGPRDPAFGEITEGEGLELPDRVIAQVHHGLVVAGIEFRIAWVPVLIGGIGFRMYRVDRHDEFAAIIEDRCGEFMDKHVRKGVPPTDCLPCLEVLKRVRRQPNKSVPLADELVDAVVATRAAKKQATDDAEKAEAALLAALGDAEQGKASRAVVSYMQQTRKAYEVKEAAFRVLRIKGAK